MKEWSSKMISVLRFGSSFKEGWSDILHQLKITVKKIKSEFGKLASDLYSQNLRF